MYAALAARPAGPRDTRAKPTQRPAHTAAHTLPPTPSGTPELEEVYVAKSVDRVLPTHAFDAIRDFFRDDAPQPPLLLPDDPVLELDAGGAMAWLRNVARELDGLGVPPPPAQQHQPPQQAGFGGAPAPSVAQLLDALDAAAPGKPAGEFTCGQCGQVFTSRKNLNSHAVRHTEGRPFKCGICPDALKRRGDLLRHVRVVHGRQTRIPCPVCLDSSTQFSGLPGLKVHLEGSHVGDPEAERMAKLITAAVVDYKRKGPAVFPAMTKSRRR